jgi:hypothetical protein
MTPIKTMLARKAAKSTAKHTAHGTAAKLRRDSLRSGVLLALGAVAGLAAGWLLARSPASRAPAPAA